MGCIYQIKNLINSKIYIGSTWKNLKARRSEHVSKLRKNKHHSPYLQYSWNKYGTDNFEFSVLEDGIERDNLQVRELYWFNLLNPVYNAARSISRGGQLYNGHSPEVMDQITEKRKKTIKERGYLHSPEARELIKQARAKQVITEEHKRKISETSKGKVYTIGRKEDPVKKKIRFQIIEKARRDKSKIQIEVYDQNMSLLFVERTATDVAKRLNVKPYLINQTLRRNKTNMCAGYNLVRKEVKVG